MMVVRRVRSLPSTTQTTLDSPSPVIYRVSVVASATSSRGARGFTVSERLRASSTRRPFTSPVLPSMAVTELLVVLPKNSVSVLLLMAAPKGLMSL
ncbi:hypothetical protein D3C78_1420480 [compost metagenome]